MVTMWVRKSRVVAIMAILAVGLYATSAYAAKGSEHEQKSNEHEQEQVEQEQTEVEQPEVQQPEVEQPEVEQPDAEQPAGNHGNTVNMSGKGKAAEHNPNVDANGNLVPGAASEQKDAAEVEQENEQAKQQDEAAREQAKQQAEAARELAKQQAEAARELAKQQAKANSLSQAQAERAAGEKGQFLVYVNGEKLNVTPLARNGRTMVPFRRLAESLGATVSWDAASKTVTMVKGDQSVVFTVGSASAVVNGATVEMPLPSELLGDSTFVPLRFIATALGAEVEYDDATGAITIIEETETPAPAPAPGTGTTDPAAPAPSTGTGN